MYNFDKMKEYIIYYPNNNFSNIVRKLMKKFKKSTIFKDRTSHKSQ